MPDSQDVPAVIAAAEQAAATGDLEGAESLLRVALQAQQAQLGAEHPDVASTLNNLAVVCEMTNRFDEAGLFYKRASELTLAALGPLHPLTVTSRDNLRAFQQARGEPLDAAEAADERPTSTLDEAVIEPTVESASLTAVEPATALFNGTAAPAVQPDEPPVTAQLPLAAAPLTEAMPPAATEPPEPTAVERSVEGPPLRQGAEHQGATAQPQKHRGSKRRGRKQQLQKQQPAPRPQGLKPTVAGAQLPGPPVPRPPASATEGAVRPAEPRAAAATAAVPTKGTGRVFVVAALVVAVVVVAAAFWWWSSGSARAAGISAPVSSAEPPAGRDSAAMATAVTTRPAAVAAESSVAVTSTSSPTAAPVATPAAVPPPASRAPSESTAVSDASEIRVLEARICGALTTGDGRWQCTPPAAPVGGRLSFYTRIASPRSTRVYHRWFRGDALMQDVPLSVGINPTAGYRTFSRQAVDPADRAEWRVELRTAEGKLLQEERIAAR